MYFLPSFQISTQLGPSLVISHQFSRRCFGYSWLVLLLDWGEPTSPLCPVSSSPYPYSSSAHRSYPSLPQSIPSWRKGGQAESCHKDNSPECLYLCDFLWKEKHWSILSLYLFPNPYFSGSTLSLNHPQLKFQCRCHQVFRLWSAFLHLYIFILIKPCSNPTSCDSTRL